MAAGSSEWEPARAVIMGFVGPGGALGMSPSDAAVAGELRSRGVGVLVLTTEDAIDPSGRFKPAITPGDLIVGSFQWTKAAAATLGVAMGEPPDYPDCLSKFTRRRIWRSTLGQAAAAVEAGLPASEPPFDVPEFFIKPASDIKSFSGGVEPRDSMLGYYLTLAEPPLPPSTPVWCAETVSFTHEYRVYVVRGEIRGVCRYIAPEGVKPFEAPYDPEVDTLFDMGVVREAVGALAESALGTELAGCSLDFGVLASGETALIEVNEGFSLGMYDGISASDFTDLLIARWGSFVGGIPDPS